MYHMKLKLFSIKYIRQSIQMLWTGTANPLLRLTPGGETHGMELRYVLSATCLLYVILSVPQLGGSQTANWKSTLSSPSVPGLGGNSGSLHWQRQAVNAMALCHGSPAKRWHKKISSKRISWNLNNPFMLTKRIWKPMGKNTTWCNSCWCSI